MTAPAVHQFVASFRPRDAIGMHALEVRAALREAGFRSELFAWDAPEGRDYKIVDYRDYGRKGRDASSLLLYQLSTGGVVGDFVIGRPERKVVSYHNITPEGFLTPWHKEFGKELQQGREQLRALASVAELGIAISRYNEAELRSAGYTNTAVAPVLVNVDSFARDPDPRLAADLRCGRGDGPAWLFVGRLVPNKCQQDLILAFAAYREAFGGRGHLRLVGAPADGSYERALHQLVHALGLDHAVQIAGSVSARELAAYYDTADVFVCLSEHEGFCVPLVEAMVKGLPVVAYSAAAVPETVGDGGLLLHDKSPLAVAAAVHRVWSDAGVHDALSEAGRRRAGAFSLAAGRARLLEVLKPVLERA